MIASNNQNIAGSGTNPSISASGNRQPRAHCDDNQKADDRGMNPNRLFLSLFNSTFDFCSIKKGIVNRFPE